MKKKEEKSEDLLWESQVLYAEELRILLGSQKIRGFYGIRLEEKNLTEEEVAVCLLQMERKGFLLYTEKGFLPCPILRGFFRALEESRDVFLLQSRRDDLLLLCLYPGRGYCAVTESCRWKKNSLKISLLEPVRLWGRLKEEGYLPCSWSARISENMPEEEMAVKTDREKLLSEGVTVQGNCLLLLQRYSKTAKRIVEAAALYEQGVERILVTARADGIEKEGYQEERFKKKITKWLGGERHDPGRCGSTCSGKKL